MHLAKKIQRFSDVTGEHAKLTCAATPAAPADALGYLTSLCTPWRQPLPSAFGKGMLTPRSIAQPRPASRAAPT